MSFSNLSSPFHWSNDESGSVLLFIAHDNPQLIQTVKKSTQIMLETKDEQDITHFIIATTVYSGTIEGVENAELFAPRGSQFLIISNLRGIKGNIKKVPTRPKGDILEIDLDGLPPSSYFQLTTCLELTSFLSSCTQRVDVILDPSHTNNWYPYWEGSRKMAPQFRSQGVGYLRLGDDMSQYGVAFLSLDAGHSFLDNGVASIVGDSTSVSSSFASSTNLSKVVPSHSKTLPAKSVGSKLAVASSSTNKRTNFKERLQLSKTTGSIPNNKTSLNNAFDSFLSGDNVVVPKAGRIYTPATLPIETGEGLTDIASQSSGLKSDTDIFTTSPTTTKPTRGRASPVKGNMQAVKMADTNAPSICSPSPKTPSPTDGRLDARQRSSTSPSSAIVYSPRQMSQLRSLLTLVRLDEPGAKWTDKVACIVQLNDFLVSNLSGLPGGEVDEVVRTVGGAVNRANNPNVIRSLVSVVSTLGPHAFSPPLLGVRDSVVLTQSQRTLLLDVIHLLRSNNRLIAEPSRVCIDGLVQRGLRLHHLCGSHIIEEILFGQRGKSIGTSSGTNSASISSAAANSIRTLDWLVSIIHRDLHDATMHAQHLVNSLSYRRSTEQVADSSNITIALLSGKNNPLLWHREASTRDSAFDLLSILLVLNIVQHFEITEGVADQITRVGELRVLSSLLNSHNGLAVNLESFGGGATLEASGIFLKLLSPDVLNCLLELEKDSSKILYKLLSNSFQHLNGALTSILERIEIPADTVPRPESLNASSTIASDAVSSPGASKLGRDISPDSAARLRRVGNRTRLSTGSDYFSPNRRGAGSSSLEPGRVSTAPTITDRKISPSSANLRTDFSAPSLLSLHHANQSSSQISTTSNQFFPSENCNDETAQDFVQISSLQGLNSDIFESNSRVLNIPTSQVDPRDVENRVGNLCKVVEVSAPVVMSLLQPFTNIIAEKSVAGDSAQSLSSKASSASASDASRPTMKSRLKDVWSRLKLLVRSVPGTLLDWEHLIKVTSIFSFITGRSINV